MHQGNTPFLYHKSSLGEGEAATSDGSRYGNCRQYRIDAVFHRPIIAHPSDNDTLMRSPRKVSMHGLSHKNRTVSLVAIAPMFLLALACSDDNSTGSRVEGSVSDLTPDDSDDSSGVPDDGSAPSDVPGIGASPSPTLGGGSPTIDDPDTPDLFESNFLWQPLNLAAADDHGFEASELDATEQVAPGELSFEEVSADVGLLSARGSGNAHGVGIGFIDTDGDGFEELFIANGEGRGELNSMLFDNESGEFTDITAVSGVGAVLDGIDTYSVAAADYDADGDTDILVGAHPRDLLLQNDGSGFFTDATDLAGAGGPPSQRTNTASKIVAFGDFDGDGLMDIASASSEFDGVTENGYLLRNLGNGTFDDITNQTGFAAASSGNPCAVMWSDIDNDGDQDLWIWNDRGNATENRVLLQNEDTLALVNITEPAGITQRIGNPMGIEAADINRDGYLDYYVSAIGNNPLYLGSSDGTFTDIARESGTVHEFGWGLGFEDFNLDTWPDIFVAQEDDQPYLAYEHNGSTDVEYERYELEHHPIESGSAAHNVAVAFADFNQDGLTDVATATTDGSRVNLYRNTTETGTQRYLEVRVTEVPDTGARGGITARVVVKTGETVQFRDLTGGSSRASQNAHSVRFGLGQWTGAEWVGVLWPDGRQLVATNIEGNQVLELTP